MQPGVCDDIGAFGYSAPRGSVEADSIAGQDRQGD